VDCLGAYIVFMALNIVGVSVAAAFELVVTLLAIFELLVFMGVVSPGFSWANFTHHGWAGSDSFSLSAIGGMLPPFRLPSGSSWPSKALPWPPKAKDPSRTIPRAYVAASSPWWPGHGRDDHGRRCR
jgi:ethanolamine permease